MSRGMSVEGKRAPQGLDAEDRLAFGLTASHLSYLLVGSLAGYALFASHVVGFVKYPLGMLFVITGGLLAWGRFERRPLDVWAWLALRYYMRPRRSPARPEPSVLGILQSTPRDSSTKRPAEPAIGVSQPGQAGEDAPLSPADRDDDTHILTLPPRTPEVASGVAADVDPSPEPGAEDAPVFMAPTQRVAFFSLKGGVGKTTLATEVATLLARRGRYRPRPDAAPLPLRVALIDVDLGSANISMKVGLTHPTLWDLILDPEPDRARVEECLLTHRESGLRVLLGPPRAIAAGEARSLATLRLAQVLMHLDEEGYHFVFLDLSSDVDELTAYGLEASHHVYYVMTPTASGVQDTYRGVETLRRLGHRRKLRFVLNQSRGGFNPEEMLADLGGTLAATVPSDDAFITAEDEHRPACLDDVSIAARSIADLAASIYPNITRPSRQAGFWQRLRGRLG